MLHTESDKSRLNGHISPECACCIGIGCYMCPIFWRENKPESERNSQEKQPRELNRRITGE